MATNIERTRWRFASPDISQGGWLAVRLMLCLKIPSRRSIGSEESEDCGDPLASRLGDLFGIACVFPVGVVDPHPKEVLKDAMKRVLLVTVAVGLLMVSAAAQRGGGGQGPGMRQGFGMAGPRLLLIPQVQAELKMTEEQVAKVREALGGAGGPGGRGAFGGGAGGGGGFGGGDPQAREQMRLEQEKKVKEILTAEQYKRYQEIALQQEGPASFARKEVADKLGLSDSQRQKVNAILEEQRATMRDMFQGGGGGGDRQAMMETMQKLREERNAKLLAILTPEQKKIWEGMLGKPFQFQRGG